MWVCVCFGIKEHNLIRNQSIAGSTLPDLSEVAEQEKGEFFCFFPFGPHKTEILVSISSRVGASWMFGKSCSIHKKMVICSIGFVPPYHPFPTVS